MTWPDPLGPGRRCPRAGRCEACGAAAREVADLPDGQWACSAPSSATRVWPPARRRECAPGARRSWRVGSHCRHLGIDLDQMADMPGRAERGRRLYR